MGKYNSGGKKKGKGGHCCRYKDEDEIEDLHGLYEDLKDDNDGGVRDDDYDDGDWENIEEKEREEDDDNGNDVVIITAVQFFGMLDEAFLGKETENKENKEEEEGKSNGSDYDGVKNSDSSAKRGEKMR